MGSEDDETKLEEDVDIDDKKERLLLNKDFHELLIENSSNKELNNTILFFFKNQVELLYFHHGYIYHYFEST